MTYTLEV